jgi:hypothetical protein
MAEKDDVILKIKEKIAQLDKDAAKSYKEQLKALNDNNAALNTYKTLLGNINDEVEDQLQGFAGLLKEIKGINDELEKEGKYVRDATKAFRGLESIASKLKNDQKGYTDLNKEQLKQERSKLKILEDQFKEAAKILQQQSLRTPQEEAIVAAYEDQNNQFQRNLKLLEKRIKEEEKINKTLGVTGVLLTGISKIPIVGPLLKTNEALDAARTKAQAGGNAFQAMGAGLGSMAKNLASSFSDPLLSIGLIVKSFKFLLDLGFKVDGIQTQLAKSFNLSADSSKRMYDSFNAIQATNEPITKGLEKSLLNTTRMAEAANELGQAFEGVLIPTRSQIENQIILTKEIGLSTEEANNLQKLAFQNRMTTEDITKEVLSQTKAYRNQTGVQLSNKKILQDVSNISGQLRLQYGNSTKQLIAATIQANKLGLSLEQTKKISESLLNFEESIENELSAELLINRDLNLEQARLLALNGKSAEATALIAEQMGGSAEFSKLNVIQQEQLAKALGMSADELANSMIYQEQLSSLGATQQQQVKDQIKELESQGRLEEAQQLQREISNGVAAEDALLRISQQDIFNQSVEKLKMMLADIVDGPALKLTQWITNLVENADALKAAVYTIVGAFGAIKLGGILLNLASMASLTGSAAAGALTWAGGITLGLGLIGVIASIATAMGAFESSKEKAAQLPTPSPPKVNFNQGGIVGGNSFTGDNMGINVNSGEMVLTRREQAEFYNMIKRGGGMGDRNTPIVVNAMIDNRVLATAMSSNEERYSNQLGSSRATSNHRPS